MSLTCGSCVFFSEQCRSCAHEKDCDASNIAGAGYCMLFDDCTYCSCEPRNRACGVARFAVSIRDERIACLESLLIAKGGRE